MRLLLCCPTPITKALGSSKVYLEVNEALNKAGGDSTLIGPNDLLPEKDFSQRSAEEEFGEYTAALKAYLDKNQKSFDVVEYEHTYYPTKQSTMLQNKLCVARSVLLKHHLPHYPFPKFLSLRRIFGEFIYGRRRRNYSEKRLEIAKKTCLEADLVNVPNNLDKERLMLEGIPENRVTVIPYGLTPERLAYLQNKSSESASPKKHIITFIGTFDERKGAVEFPKIVDFVLKKHPNAVFRLLGTSGQFKTKKEVLDKFKAAHAPQLEVFPTFDPDGLKSLLKGTTIGMFPSHLESFGFGVLEMMASGIPVVAYNVPGPSSLLRPDMLVHRGDYIAMARVISNWIEDENKRRASIIWAEERAKEFEWSRFANQTLKEYEAALKNKIDRARS